MEGCVLKIVNPQRHLSHLCRPLLLELLAGVNGEEIHFSRHGPTRMNQLVIGLVSNMSTSFLGGVTYCNSICLSQFMIFGDPVSDQGRDCGA